MSFALFINSQLVIAEDLNQIFVNKNGSAKIALPVEKGLHTFKLKCTFQQSNRHSKAQVSLTVDKKSSSANVKLSRKNSVNATVTFTRKTLKKSASIQLPSLAKQCSLTTSGPINLPVPPVPIPSLIPTPIATPIQSPPPTFSPSPSPSASPTPTPPVNPVPVTFPIEILDNGMFTNTRSGTSTLGRSEIRKISFSSTPSNIVGLDLSLFNVMYRGEASITINGAAPIPIDPEHVKALPPYDKLSWHGSDMTVDRFVKVRVPVSAGLLQKENTIKFSFLKTDGAISGFRVVTMQFVDQVGAEVKPTTQFKNDDPLAWTAPSSDSNAPARGLKLWHEAVLSENPNNPVFLAGHCADCHGGGFKSTDENGQVIYAHSGKDLQKYALSNESIITRAEFHGLSRSDAVDIASYIRSLDEVPNGRPWSAYQPGTVNNVKLTDKPAEDFAVGMGVESLVSDRTMVDNILSVISNTSIPIDTRIDDLNIINLNASILTPNIFEWWGRQSVIGLVDQNSSSLKTLAVRDNKLRTFVEQNLSMTSTQASSDFSPKASEVGTGYWALIRPLTFDLNQGLARNSNEAEVMHAANLLKFINMWDLTRGVERSGVNAGSTIASHNVPGGGLALLASPRFVAVPWNPNDLGSFRFKQLEPATIFGSISWDYLALVQSSITLAKVDGLDNAVNASTNLEFGYRVNAFTEAFASVNFKDNPYDLVGPFYSTMLQAVKIQSHGKEWGEYIRDCLTDFVGSSYMYTTIPGWNMANPTAMRLSDARLVVKAAIHYKFASLKQFSDDQLRQNNRVTKDNITIVPTKNLIDSFYLNDPYSCVNNQATVNGVSYTVNRTPVGLFACLETQLNAFGLELEPGSEALKQKVRLDTLFH